MAITFERYFDLLSRQLAIYLETEHGVARKDLHKYYKYFPKKPDYIDSYPQVRSLEKQLVDKMLVVCKSNDKVKNAKIINSIGAIVYKSRDIFLHNGILGSLKNNLVAIDPNAFSDIIKKCDNFRLDKSNIRKQYWPTVKAVVGEISRDIRKFTQGKCPDKLHDDKKKALLRINQIAYELAGEEIIDKSNAKSLATGVKIIDDYTPEKSSEIMRQFILAAKTKLKLTPVSNIPKPTSDKEKEEEDDENIVTQYPEKLVYKTENNIEVTFTSTNDHWQANSEDLDALVNIVKEMANISGNNAIDIISNGDHNKDVTLYNKLTAAGLVVTNPPASVKKQSGKSPQTDFFKTCGQEQHELDEQATGQQTLNPATLPPISI